MFKDETRTVSLLILITSCGTFTDFFIVLTSNFQNVLLFIWKFALFPFISSDFVVHVEITNKKKVTIIFVVIVDL